MSRPEPLSKESRATLPQFPSSECDVMAMRALDAVCSQGLVRAGTALAALVSSCAGCEQGGCVKMTTIADKDRPRLLPEYRRVLARHGCEVAAVGFAELLEENGTPVHRLHLENRSVLLRFTRPAFLDLETGHPVSLGNAQAESFCSFTAPDGLFFWSRAARPEESPTPDTHHEIDKPRKPRRRL